MQLSSPVIGSIHANELRIVSDGIELWKGEMLRFALVACIDSILPKGGLEHIHLIQCMFHLLQNVAIMGAILRKSPEVNCCSCIHDHCFIWCHTFKRGVTTAINCRVAASAQHRSIVWHCWNLWSSEIEGQVDLILQYLAKQIYHRHLVYAFLWLLQKDGILSGQLGKIPFNNWCSISTIIAVWINGSMQNKTSPSLPCLFCWCRKGFVAAR